MKATITGAMVAMLATVSLVALTGAGAATGPLGANFRVSFMGPDGNPDYHAGTASVAYNPTAGEYLVVWDGDDNTAPLVDNEREIFAQRLSASGAPLGERMRVSEQGTDGDPESEVASPSVAYNPSTNQYLVVWSGEIATSEDFEIWAQRLSSTGQEVGGSDFQISNMGPGGGANYSAFGPSVAANPTTGEYLVVWSGDHNVMPLVDGEFEIFGQRLSAEGVQVDPNDFRISDIGPNGNANHDANNPNVAYNATGNGYLVAWESDDLVDGETEIFAQRLSAEAAGVGVNFPISDMGPDGNAAHDAEDPVIAVNPAAGEYLVVWEGDDLADQEFSIFGQRLSADGAPQGANDFRVSEQGADGDPASDAENPSVVSGAIAGEYLVAWAGDTTGALVDSEFEIWAQLLSSTGAEVGSDLRISQMGPDGDATYTAQFPRIAANPAASEYLVVWVGDDDTPPLVDNESEIFGQRLGEPPPSPAPPPPPPAPPPAPSTDRLAPVVSGFAVSPARFRRTRGAWFRFRLSERSTARILLERALPGRRVGRRCVRPAATLRRNRRCTRFRRAGTLTFRNRPAGANRIAFHGRIGRRALAVGSYRATITATDAAGNRSRPRRASFRVAAGQPVRLGRG